MTHIVTDLKTGLTARVTFVRAAVPDTFDIIDSNGEKIGIWDTKRRLYTFEKIKNYLVTSETQHTKRHSSLTG